MMEGAHRLTLTPLFDIDISALQSATEYGST